MHFNLFALFEDTRFNQSLNTSTNSLNQKKPRIRPAIIDCSDEDDMEIVAETPKRKASIVSVNMAEHGGRDHLETMKQVEQMRKEHGNNWLQNVTTIQSPSTTNEETKKRQYTEEELFESLFGIKDDSQDNRTSTPANGQSTNSLVDVS